MKRTSPAFPKNHAPILGVLRELLAPGAVVLELGSGPGQHAALFARELPEVQWHPSERPGNTGSVDAWRAEHGDENLHPARAIDLSNAQWADAVALRPDLIMSVNVIHASTPEVWRHIVEGAAQLLAPGGRLWFYGPFRSTKRALEPSNARFDEHLQQRGPGWGLRTLETIEAHAAPLGLRLEEDRALPSNNRAVWFVRR